jgi:hypothetical protein
MKEKQLSYSLEIYHDQAIITGWIPCNILKQLIKICEFEGYTHIAAREDGIKGFILTKKSADYEDDKKIRFLLDTAEAKNFIYKPSNYSKDSLRECSMGVKFSQGRIILDDWWLIGGTRWSRTLFRLKHPIIYSKRGFKNIYRKIRSLFIKDKMRPL